MSRKIGAAVALLAAAASLTLTACGKDDDGGSGALKGQTVEVAAVWSGDEQKKFEAVLEGFKKKTGADWKFTSTGNNIAQILGGRIQGNSPPDLAMLPQPGLLADLAKQGALKPLPDAAATAVGNNFAPIWKTLGTAADGKLYGIYFKVANKSLMWYRTKAFEDAGVKVPATWEELTAGLTSLSDSGTTPLSVAGGDGWTLTDWFENVYLRVAGGAKYDQLAKHGIPWTDQSVVDSLQVLSDLWKRPNVMVGGTSGAGQITFPQSVVNVFGKDAKAAIVFEGDFVATNIAQQTEAKVGDTAKFFNFPSIKSSPASVVGGGDVAVALKDTAAAKELMAYLATPEAAEIWAKKGGFLSANKNMPTSAYPDDSTKQMGEAIIKAGDNFRFDLSDLLPSAFGGTPNAGMWKVLQDFLANPTNVAGTAAALEAEAKKVQ